MKKENQPQINIRLDIAKVKVLRMEMTEKGEIIIGVESEERGTRCRKCGREIEEYHGVDEQIRLRHLPILGQAVYIEISPKRYRCPYCEDRPTTTQKLEWYRAKSGCTKAYERQVMLQLVNSTVADVSAKEGLGYEAVMGVLEREIATEVDWETVMGCEVLGLDEIALKKGHRDFVVIVTGRHGDGRIQVLGVLGDRRKETVKAFLKGLPEAIKDQIKTVCTDLYEGYINAVKEELPTAKIVADRFHIAKLYRESADHLRKQEYRRLKAELPEAEMAELKGSVWAFRQNPADLEADGQAVLERLLEASPALSQAYELREDLTAIFDQDLSKAEATRCIEQWQDRVRSSGVTCFDAFLKTLDGWKEEITNYFLDRLSSGFIEGLNNKIKVIKRRCYGILNPTHLFQRITLDLDGYRLYGPPAPI